MSEDPAPKHYRESSPSTEASTPTTVSAVLSDTSSVGSGESLNELEKAAAAAKEYKSKYDEVVDKFDKVVNKYEDMAHWLKKNDLWRQYAEEQMGASSSTKRCSDDVEDSIAHKRKRPDSPTTDSEDEDNKDTGMSK